MCCEILTINFLLVCAQQQHVVTPLLHAYFIVGGHKNHMQSSPSFTIYRWLLPNRTNRKVRLTDQSKELPDKTFIPFPNNLYRSKVVWGCFNTNTNNQHTTWHTIILLYIMRLINIYMWPPGRVPNFKLA